MFCLEPGRTASSAAAARAAGSAHDLEPVSYSRGVQWSRSRGGLNLGEIPRELYKLAARLVALKKRARSLGIFVEDRELLECPGCGLLEDVTSIGGWITCEPSSLGQDTGLRFQALPSDRFRCPRCGTVVTER